MNDNQIKFFRADKSAPAEFGGYVQVREGQTRGFSPTGY